MLSAPVPASLCGPRKWHPYSLALTALGSATSPQTQLREKRFCEIGGTGELPPIKKSHMAKHQRTPPAQQSWKGSPSTWPQSQNCLQLGSSQPRRCVSALHLVLVLIGPALYLLRGQTPLHPPHSARPSSQCSLSSLPTEIHFLQHHQS